MGMEDGAAVRMRGAEPPVPEILWQSCDGMMVIDERRRVLAINPALERMIGRKAQEVVGKMECGTLFSCRDAHGCPLKDRPTECPGLKAIDRLEPILSAEYMIKAAAGRRVAVSASYTPVQLPGHPVWTLVVMRDMTLKKRREHQLIRQAMTDPLTGLPNRTAFRNACVKELKRMARNPRPFAIAMIDIDGFKKYNDIAGHPAGDGLLKVLAGLIQVGRRATDLVARYGGDEFALLLPETDAAGTMVVAQRLCSTVAKFPLVVLPSPGPLTISVGLAVYPDDGRTPEVLLSQADQRLYQAKRQGGDRVVGPD